MGTRPNLNGMNLDMPESCEHLRITLKLPLKEALKLHREAQAKRLSAGDWIAELLQINVLPAREPVIVPGAGSQRC
jgi:hypothetical protein